MKLKIIILLTVFSFNVCKSRLLKAQSSDVIIQLISNAGYKGEAHRVETDDGYVLKVHRLLPKKNDLKSVKKPVFLMHGILATAADFLITGPDIALAYLLADNGYDVWLGNARGSQHSPKHKKFSPDSKEFWTFSWHEIGFYDLPAMLDYMLKVTKASKAFYVGHSQGTTSFLVLLSTRPEYNEKIIQAHLMAPVSFSFHLPHPLVRSFAMRAKDGLLDGSHFLDIHRIWRMMKVLSKFACKGMKEPTLRTCEGAVFAVFFIFGPNTKGIEIDTRIFAKLVYHLSSRSSAMQLMHYSQLIFSKKFQMFDYGEENFIRYKSKTPPEYKLANVRTAVHLYRGADDLFTSMIDVKHLKNVLLNAQCYRNVPNWSHLDFVYGRNARRVLYVDILRSFEMAKLKCC